MGGASYVIFGFIFFGIIVALRAFVIFAVEIFEKKLSADFNSSFKLFHFFSSLKFFCDLYMGVSAITTFLFIGLSDNAITESIKQAAGIEQPINKEEYFLLNFIGFAGLVGIVFYNFKTLKTFVSDEIGKALKPKA